MATVQACRAANYKSGCGMKNQGFTMVELLIVMVIFIAVIIISTTAFESIVKRGGQQVRSAQTQITGRVGLEMMRSAISHAGYGLFWSFQTTPTTHVKEVTVQPETYLDVDSGLFDGFDDYVSNAAPRAVAVGATADGDYLVIKSTMLGMDAASRKWSYMNYSTSSGANASYIRAIAQPDPAWGSSDRAIIINSTFNAGESKQLAMNGAAFYYKFSDALDSNFMPTDSFQKRIVYGVASQNLNMPYNRTDFYLNMKDPNKPQSCNPGTGVLYMAVAGQNQNYVGADGEKLRYPLLDCVGDMQVVFDRIKDNGTFSASDELRDPDTGDVMDAAGIRAKLRTVRVYLLAQEGKKDPSFAYPGDSIKVGPDGLGTEWTPTTMSAKFGSDWRNYRWNVYSFTVNLKNLQ